MRRSVLASLVSLLVLSLAPAAHGQTAIGKEGLQEDFRYLVTALEETHPDPYSAFGGKVAYHRAAREFLSRISDETTLAGFRDLAEEFMAVLEDGHTGLNSAGTGDEGSRRVLPLRFRIAVDGLFVDRAAADYQELVGGLVLMVGSEPVDALLPVVRRLTPSENSYGTFRDLVRMIRVEGSASRLVPLDSGTLPFTLLMPGGDTLSVTVPFQDEAEVIRPESRLRIGRARPLLYWDLIGPDENVGYFSWSSIMSREVVEAMLRQGDMRSAESLLDWGYRYLPDATRSGDPRTDVTRIPALYSAFREMLEAMRERGSKYLIIDLRRNGGGMTPLVRPLFYMMYGDEFLAREFEAEYNTLISPLYLAKSGYASVEELNEARGTDLRLGEYRFSYFWHTDADATPEERRSIDAVTYFSRVGEEYVADLEGKPIYTPEVIVLTAPETFSAAYHFMYFLWQMGHTTVVGVPPRQAGNAYMEVTPFELPNTGLGGSISNAVQVFFADDPARGKVFEPEFPMRWSDFARYGFDRNAEVLYALDLIAAGKIGSR